ncbi:hypothetical protein ALO54_101449 [Pseudomonas syringae pv. philadelphi]|nr:hypothetical protein ALO54_101449 [Pseudomonas syringae pv. philadelphi]RMM37581.1 hypothetical protein ALQ83_101498 [Pseudomonas syringae pv. berberidis]
MIQCPAAGALDLEFGVVTHAKQQLLALPASIVFQHLHWSPFASPKEKPRLGGVWVIAIYRSVLLKSPYPAAALRQIAYRGAFLPPSGKAGKGQFRGGSSLAGVQHQFDHSCAIGPDKRYV